MLDTEAALNKNLFDLGLQMKHLLAKSLVGKSIPGAVSGVKLPKTDASTFDSNILNWGIFWKQFRAIIHCRDQILLDADKLTYLQYPLRDGTAKHAIEGFTQSTGSYNKAIDCPQKC